MGWLADYFRRTFVRSGGADMPDRDALNFIGFTVADNPATNAIDVTAAGGGGGATPWHNVPRTTKTANYTVLSTDYLIVCRTNSGFTVSLPASPSDGDTYAVKNRSPAANTVAGNGHNIDGASTYSLPPNASITVTYDSGATEWVIQ